MKRGFTALLLSLVQPGLGQLYNRQARKAFIYLAFLPTLIVIVSLLGLAHTFRGFVFWLAVSFLFQIGAAVEAYVVAFRQKSVPLTHLGAGAIAAFAILAVTHVALVASGVYTNRILGLRGLVVNSESMAPTLVIGDRFLVDTNAYSHATPMRGDIIVFSVPGASNTIYAKRIAAVAGDTLRVTRGRVILNQEPLERRTITKAAAVGISQPIRSTDCTAQVGIRPRGRPAK